MKFTGEFLGETSIFVWRVVAVLCAYFGQSLLGHLEDEIMMIFSK